MALSAGTIWEVEVSGSDIACSGGFNPSNANMATDGAVTSANTASPVFSSASYNFVANDVAAWLYDKAGTSGIPGSYKIVSVASNAATLNGTIGQAVLANLTPSTVVGCGTTGTLSNQTWSVDYSQQSSAKISYTDMIISVTTTNYTSVANPVGKNIIGNLINVTAGTNFTTGLFEIVSTSTITATCDRSLGTAAATGGTGFLGGAFASPGQAASVVVSGNAIYVKAANFSITSASANVSGGCVSFAVQCNLIAYSGIRGVLGTGTLTASGISTASLATMSAGTYSIVRGFKLDGASLSTITGLTISGGATRSYVLNIRCTNCTTGLSLTASQMQSLTDFEIDHCTTGLTDSSGIPSLLTTFNLHDNATAMNVAAAAYFVGTKFLVVNNSVGMLITNTPIQIDGFTFFGNSTAAISGANWFNSAREAFIRNSAFYGNGSDITQTGANGVGFISLNNAASSSFSTSLFAINESFQLLTANPFNNSSIGDFSPNNTAGGGALLRAKGIPGTFPGGLTTSFIDIGAVQHADSGGGSILQGRGILSGSVM